jgi:YVTN family beta-propeller protein
MKRFYLQRHCALAAAILLPLLLDACATARPDRASPASYAVIDRVPSVGEGGWDFVTFDSAKRRLFISRSDRVQVWSADSKQVVAEIADTEGVHGVALAADLGRGFTSNGRSNTVSVFALQDLHVIQKIPIPGVNPDAILYEPTSRRVYVFNGRSNDATVIDAVTLRLLATIPLGGKPEVAVGDGRGHVFVNIENTSELVVIDQATDTVQARWPLAPCEEPTGLAIDVAHGRLFSACANHTMAIVDSGSGRVVGQVPIGAEPDGAEFDASLGLAISSNGEGSLTLVREIDPEHFAVVSTVATQPRARTLSLDPISHRIYLVSAAFGPPAEATAQQPRPRAPMLRDSFTVLVVAPQ